jgi:hypothetical protein
MWDGLNNRNLSRSTLVSAFPSAIADIFRFEVSSPTSGGLVREMKSAITRLTPPSVQKLPITRAQLISMAHTTLPCEQGIRDMFMMILMFLAFLRESEVVALSFFDVWVERIDGSEVLFIFVEKAKNDQKRRGHTIVVEACQSSCICAVKWFKLHCSVRRSKLAVFHSSSLAPNRLSSSAPNSVIKRLLSSIGVDPAPYGSHSLRRGGVSAASQAGVSIHVLARHGNWKSDAVFMYVSDSFAQKLSVGNAILS